MRAIITRRPTPPAPGIRGTRGTRRGWRDSAPRRGFTLVSVMVAVILLTIGLLALARLQTALVSSQVDEGWRTSALAAARSYVEEVRARDPWTLTSEAAVTLDETGTPAVSGPLRRTLTVTEKSANLLEVRVSVVMLRGVSPVELTTYVYRGAK